MGKRNIETLPGLDITQISSPSARFTALNFNHIIKDIPVWIGIVIFI